MLEEQRFQGLLLPEEINPKLIRLLLNQRTLKKNLWTRSWRPQEAKQSLNKYLFIESLRLNYY
jgi:hypothetical protein